MGFVFYILVLMIVPSLSWMIGNYFRLQYLPEEDLMALGLTGSYYILGTMYYMDPSVRRGLIYGVLSGLVVNLVGQAVAASLHVGLGGFMLVSITGEAAVLLVMLLYNHIRRDLFSFSLSSVQPRQFFHVVRLGLPAGAEYLYYVIYVFFIYRYTPLHGRAFLYSGSLCDNRLW